MNELENTQQPEAENAATQEQEQPETPAAETPVQQSVPQPEEPAPVEQPATAVDSTDMQRLIAEAEQRGYLRGRNEAIEQLMQAPSLFGGTVTAQERVAESDPAEGFLSGLRPGVWD